MKKKTIALMLVMMMVFGITVGGTIAYLTDSKTVTNTFTVGNVKIKLDEAKTDIAGIVPVDDNQKEIRTEEGNEYKLLPGHTYAKDPTVTVLEGSEESYIRMLVTINEQKDLDAIFADNDGAVLSTLLGGVSADWTLVKETENTDDTRTYEFRYKETVAAPDNDVVLDDLFETITVPGTINNDQLATISDLEIGVVAQAIQKDGFANADAAWAAWTN